MVKEQQIQQVHLKLRLIIDLEIDVVVVVVVVVDLTSPRIMKSVVAGQVPVTLEWRNTPGKKHEQPKGGTRIPGTITS